MATLKLNNVCKSFGLVEIIKGVDLDIKDGEFVVFVGPSGCGKSTLLRMISGLEEVTEGDMWLDDERVNDHTPFERGVAMVFQSYALYPHMTVAENMGFPLKMVNASASEIEQKIAAAADILQLGHLLDRRPDQLSGGQKQRVAMGRTIVRDPKLFLFDEPLSNLDADLRIEMRIEIEKLHKRLAATMIYVTHDQVEAMTLADRIVVLRDGVIEQTGAPLDLYERPANTFVASFLGSPKINFLDATLIDCDSTSSKLALQDGTEVALPIAADVTQKGQSMKIGIRPEDLVLGDGHFQIPFQMELHERLGPTSYLYGESAGSKVIAEHRGRGSVDPTQAKSLGVDAAQAHLFDRNGVSVLSAGGTA
ncbi:MAG: sn-glycerol-3-phosphate ABC transporter ATP-binding protein UgpC [Rhodobacteraceae bacterium]|nr:sn-glycerol-3-phosphate ABC transporter ATP-binding protein UgpC [Paracoccaceae bacterium]